MTVQLGTLVRNAMLDAEETVVGASPKLQLRTGAQPANCAAADSGSLLAELTLPADWMNDAATGQKTLKGTWSGTATGAGTALHYRIKDSTGATCHEQGSVGQGSGDLSLDNNVIAIGQTINITTFTKTAPNA